MNLCHHIWKCCFLVGYIYIYITETEDCNISIKNYNKIVNKNDIETEDCNIWNYRNTFSLGFLVVSLGCAKKIAGLIYGIVNKAIGDDIVFMCLIFLFISTVSVFDKNENSKP